ncbi:hypothetical protein [Streptomyces venezuelae]|uniref:hypothetical protein n=1 Tax=Streptomyces venezuelae TaxID=54571 RepID=UPI00332C0854
MSKQKRRDEVTTPPSKAPGESGDREARREAEEALAPGQGEGDAPSPKSKAQKRATRRDRPGH